MSVYGFTQDNTRRPTAQTEHFRSACVAFAQEIVRRGAALLVVGDERSSQFPAELAGYRQRCAGGIKVNFLVNYGWEWDLDGLRTGQLHSEQVSRMELIVRWAAVVASAVFCPCNRSMPTSMSWTNSGQTLTHRISTALSPGSRSRTAPWAAERCGVLPP